MAPINVKNKVKDRYLLQKQFFEGYKNVGKTSIIVLKFHMYIILNRYLKFYALQIKRFIYIYIYIEWILITLNIDIAYPKLGIS